MRRQDIARLEACFMWWTPLVYVVVPRAACCVFGRSGADVPVALQNTLTSAVHKIVWKVVFGDGLPLSV